jgi:GNAT superfamily N-acetyltransferase
MATKTVALSHVALAGAKRVLRANHSLGATITKMLHIRSLSNTDSLQEITGLLHRGYARLGAMGLNYTAVDQTSEVTAQRIEGGECFLAIWNGRIAGTVLAKPTDTQSECVYFTKQGVASLRQFAVDPELQGKGIGRALIARCESWAVDTSHAELALDTAEPAEHLVKLYSSLGYNKVGTVQWPGKRYRSVVMSNAVSGV